MTETIDPKVYERWRSTPLGALTEQVELRTVFELAGPLTGKRALDVGTGDGAYAIEAAIRGAHVTALDTSTAMLEAANARAVQRSVSLRLSTGAAEQLPFDSKSFDIVIAVTVLCFVSDARSAFRELFRVLAPGGKVVIGELGRWSLWAAKRKLLSLGRRTMWSDVHFWTRKELARLLIEAGFEIEASRGAVYFPPLAGLARRMVSLEPVLTRFGTLGAAFLCVAARKPRITGQCND